MFAVFDYDGPMVGDDFLGVAKLPLSWVRKLCLDVHTLWKY